MRDDKLAIIAKLTKEELPAYKREASGRGYIDGELAAIMAREIQLGIVKKGKR